MVHMGVHTRPGPRSTPWPGGSRPVRTMLVTGQLTELPPTSDTRPAHAAPHLLGLSLRLVLRALKLSFSGVSSKDRRTLERRPWQNGADLSRRPSRLPAAPASPAQACPEPGRAAGPGQRQQRAVSQKHPISLPATHHPAPAPHGQRQSRSQLEHGLRPPRAHLRDVRNKIFPEGQAAPNEPHGYDVMGQAHNVLIEPAARP